MEGFGLVFLFLFENIFNIKLKEKKKNRAKYTLVIWSIQVILIYFLGFYMMTMIAINLLTELMLNKHEMRLIV